MSRSYKTTRLGPRVSFCTSSSDSGPVHVFGDSDSTFEWDGNAQFDGALSANSHLQIGSTGAAITGIYRSTISVDFPSCAGHDSTSTSALINTLPATAFVLAVQPASIWSGSYLDLNLSAAPSSASTLRLVATNSAVTAVDPDAMNFDIVWATIS